MPNSKQRREAERRRLERQLRRRAQREARRRRMLAVVSVVGVLAVVAVVVGFVVMTGNDKETTAGSGEQSSSAPASASPSAGSSAATAASYPCTWTRTGAAARSVTVPATTKPPRKGKVDASVHTNRGTMTFTLNRAEAPCAVASFLSLAQQHYFDGTPCHRLTSGGLSVLQCGDPTGTGSGGPGYSFKDELTGKEKYTRGVLAMANSGKDTNGSQFFIVYKNSQLSPNYTVFGTVSKGLGVVDEVAAKGSDPAGDGKPKLPITLTKVLAAK